jgi:hypothetical protein
VELLLDKGLEKLWERKGWTLKLAEELEVGSV